MQDQAAMDSDTEDDETEGTVSEGEGTPLSAGDAAGAQGPRTPTLAMPRAIKARVVMLRNSSEGRSRPTRLTAAAASLTSAYPSIWLCPTTPGPP
jgi:hypothetical protein